MLVKDNTAEYIVSQQKRNYHETIYGGAIGIKETFEDHNQFTHRSYRVEHNKSTSRKKKVVALNDIKKFCMQPRNILTNFKPEPTRKVPARLISMHHIKSFILRVLLALNNTKIYLRLNPNAQR